MPPGIYPHKKVDPLVRFRKHWKLGTGHEYNGESCWEWTSSKTKGGYGTFWNGYRPLGAHVFAYEHHRGSVREGLQLDHLCRNRGCVNPLHLEPVTRKENCRRGRNAEREKTHCPQGHPYNEENTYVDSQGWRHCRTCQKQRHEEKRRAA